MTLAERIEEARTHIEAGRKEEAKIIYDKVLEEVPVPTTGVERVARGEALVFRAREAIAQLRFGTAADWYWDALKADPLATEYRLELCLNALIPMGAIKDAKHEIERALKFEPENPKAWRTLGAIEHELCNAKESIEAYDNQIKYDPDNPCAWLDRITIALDVQDYDLVRKLADKVIKTSFAADGYHCLAMVAYREERYLDALPLYEKAIKGKCTDTAMARWNKSLVLHSIGAYKGAWVEHEQRGLQKANKSLALAMNRFVKPIWNHQPPPAKLHIHEEQGFGDTLALARYVPILADRGYEVSFEVREALVQLMKQSFPKVNVVERAPDFPGAFRIPNFDYHIPSLTLPALFQTTIKTIPWNGPYLKADPNLVMKYRDLVPRGAIGLCWSSGIRDYGIWIKEYGKRKSVHFDNLAPLLQLSKKFVSLQVGPERAHHAGWLIDVLPEKPDWAETAALLECLDLVITVDTSVAHLAGAMGKPTWIMMHRGGTWHFMAEMAGSAWQTASPWYPSVRLYRQKKPHEWDAVVAKIIKDLKNRNM